MLLLPSVNSSLILFFSSSLFLVTLLKGIEIGIESARESRKLAEKALRKIDEVHIQ